VNLIRVPLIGDKLFVTTNKTDDEFKFIGTISYIIPPREDDDDCDYDVHTFMWTDTDGMEKGPFRLYSDESTWDETIFGYVVDMF
jgi:hypothetical protein